MQIRPGACNGVRPFRRLLPALLAFAFCCFNLQPSTFNLLLNVQRSTFNVAAAAPAPPPKPPETELVERVGGLRLPVDPSEGAPPVAVKLWKLPDQPAERTSTRKRFPVRGQWRFAPVKDPDIVVDRAKMGYIELPSGWQSPNSRVLDPQHKPAGGQWEGTPLKDFPYAWYEWNLDVPGEWVYRRIRLDLGILPDDCVLIANDEAVPPLPPVGGQDPGRKVYDITESLWYGGPNRLYFFCRPRPALDKPNPSRERRRADDKAPTKPVIVPPPAPIANAGLVTDITLEFLPVGIRFDDVAVGPPADRPDAKAPTAMEARVVLARPPGFPVISGGAAAIGKAPLTVLGRLETAGPNPRRLKDFSWNVSPQADATRFVRLPLDLSTVPPAELARPQPPRLRLSVKFADGHRPVDEFYPVPIAPAKP